MPLMILLCACGGGDSDGNGDTSNADRLFSDYAAASGGLRRFVSAEALSTNPRPAGACGDASPFSRSWISDHIQKNGGEITLDRDSQFCAISQGVDICLSRVGSQGYSYHISSEYNLSRYEVNLQVDMGGGRTVMFDSKLGLMGSTVNHRSNRISALQRENAAMNINTCQSSTTHRQSGDINGRWTGYRVTYNETNRSGSLEGNHQMVCTAGTCRIESAPVADMTFAAVQQPGYWYYSYATISAGAVMTPDKMTLGVWQCVGTYPTQTLIDPSCQMYAFNRSGS